MTTPTLPEIRAQNIKNSLPALREAVRRYWARTGDQLINLWIDATPADQRSHRPNIDIYECLYSFYSLVIEHERLQNAPCFQLTLMMANPSPKTTVFSDEAIISDLKAYWKIKQDIRSWPHSVNISHEQIAPSLRVEIGAKHAEVPELIINEWRQHQSIVIPGSFKLAVQPDPYYVRMYLMRYIQPTYRVHRHILHDDWNRACQLTLDHLALHYHEAQQAVLNRWFEAIPQSEFLRDHCNRVFEHIAAQLAEVDYNTKRDCISPLAREYRNWVSLWSYVLCEDVELTQPPTQQIWSALEQLMQIVQRKKGYLTIPHEQYLEQLHRRACKRADEHLPPTDPLVVEIHALDLPALTAHNSNALEDMLDTLLETDFQRPQLLHFMLRRLIHSTPDEQGKFTS